MTTFHNKGDHDNQMLCYHDLLMKVMFFTLQQQSITLGNFRP